MNSQHEHVEPFPQRFTPPRDAAKGRGQGTRPARSRRLSAILVTKRRAQKRGSHPFLRKIRENR